MTQPLFIEPTRYLEKVAVEMRLPEDPNRWPQEILQELYKQVPYVADFEPHVEMDRADGEKGYGFGHVEISNQTEAPAGSTPDQLQAAGIRGVRVPVIVREGMLQPLDLLVTDNSKILPLTEARLRQAIFRPQAFDVTARTPGDQSMIGQLYPPYRQNYGMGGGGLAMSTGIGKQAEKTALERYLETEALTEKNAGAMEDYFLGEGIRHGRLGKRSEVFDAGTGGTEAFLRKNAAEKCKECGKAMPCSCTKKTASLLSAILSTVNVSDYAEFIEDMAAPQLQAAYIKNAAAASSGVKLLLDHDPAAQPTNKVAGAFEALIAPSVVQLSKVSNGYTVKAASHLYWKPQDQAITHAEAMERFGNKVVLAADVSGSVTMGEGADATTPTSSAPRPGPVTHSGVYKVMDQQATEHIGIVIPNLLDIDGVELPIALFTNGSVSAVQTDIAGVSVGQVQDLPVGPVGGRGFFFKVDNGKICATIPFNCNSSTSMPGEPADQQCETFDGRPVSISQQPNIQTIMSTPDGKLLIPQDWRWSPLDKTQAVDLAGGETGDQEAKVAEFLGSVRLRSGGETFDVEGLPVQKLAADECRGLDVADTMFVLVGLGVHPDHAIAKMAEALTGREAVQVKVGRTLTPATEQWEQAIKMAAARVVPDLKQNLFKEAAFIPDPVAVDTVLSLGFVNPENLSIFVAYLPEIDEAQAHMCELLLASRLGMSEVPVGALEKAIKATEQVIEGLRVLAFTE